MEASLTRVTVPPRARRLGAAGAVLLLLGIVFAGLCRITSGGERHSYSASAVPRDSVHLTQGHTYLLSVPGGVAALQKHDLSPSGLRCEWSLAGSGTQTLSVELYGADSKATDAIGSFVAPATGQIHVDCIGWGTVFVDDADDASGDLSGLLLVLCVVTFTLGAAFGLSALRSRRETFVRNSARAASENDEIERLIHLVHVRSEDGEVGGGDGDDVPQ